VRPLSSLRLAFAAPTGKPGKDTIMIAAPRLYHIALGRPLRLAVRWPNATGLTSYLSGCLSLTSQRCRFRHRRRSGSLTSLSLGPDTSRFERSLCLAFQRLSFGGFHTARVARSVLAHSSNHLPSG